MAWRCTGKTNIALVDNLKSAGILSSPTVIAAMKRVDRRNYVRDEDESFAYHDSPQAIGYGATISAPHMHAHAAEHVLSYIKPNFKILDIGSGSGYLAALFYQIGQNQTTENTDVSAGSSGSGKVVGIEHVKELMEWSIHNLRKDGFGKEIDEGRIIMIAGDGRKGYPEEAPYDVIHVGAASSDREMTVLLDQLAPGGRMFVPVESGFGGQEIVVMDKKSDGSVMKKNLMGVRYVPLTDLDQQHRY